MGVRAGETLTIGSEFAVKNSSMTLAFNLDEKPQNRRRNLSENENF